MNIIYYHFYTPDPNEKKHAAEHNLGLKLLQKGLEQSCHITLDDTQLQSQIIKNRFEKPFLQQYPHIHFNISHCSGLVACALSDEEIGIDAEQIKTARPSIIRKFLTDDEKRFLDSFKACPALYNEVFFRFWTLKESRIKQDGRGLSMPMTGFSFKIDLSCEPAIITGSEKDIHFYQYKVSDSHILSVCQCSATKPELSPATKPELSPQ